jgi:hypothetical protein
MAYGYTALPAAQIKNALIDFSPIGEGAQAMAKGLNQGYDNETNALAGGRLKAGDYAGAAGVYADRGEAAKALELTKYKDERDAAARARQEKEATVWASRAEAAMHMPGPIRAKFWEEQLRSYPEQHEITPDLRDPNKGPQLIMGKAGKWYKPEGLKFHTVKDEWGGEQTMVERGGRLVPATSLMGGGASGGLPGGFTPYNPGGPAAAAPAQAPAPSPESFSVVSPSVAAPAPAPVQSAPVPQGPQVPRGPDPRAAGPQVPRGPDPVGAFESAAGGGGSGESGSSYVPPPRAPAQAPQAPASEANLLVGPAVPPARVPRGYTQRITPDGRALWTMGPQGRPIPLFDNEEEVKERGKVQAGRAVEQETLGKFDKAIAIMRQHPTRYGKDAFERSIGPYASSKPDAGEGHVESTMNFLGRTLARATSEAGQSVGGGAEPTDVRDAVNTDALRIATVMKPFVRKTGEGPWTDRDQANLENQVGDLGRARSVKEYNARLDRLQQYIREVLIPVARQTGGGSPTGSVGGSGAGQVGADLGGGFVYRGQE